MSTPTEKPSPEAVEAAKDIIVDVVRIHMGERGPFGINEVENIIQAAIDNSRSRQPESERPFACVIGGTFFCPCGAHHSRGPVNGVDSYRCLKCGQTSKMLSKEDAIQACVRQPEQEDTARLIRPSELFNASECEFIELVCKNPGGKLSGAIGNDAPWKRPEEQGLVRCVGSYKWEPTEKLVIAIDAARTAPATDKKA